MVEVGEIYLDKRGDKMLVLSINSYSQATVEFVDYGFVTNALIRNIQQGKVKNKMYPTVCGKGFVGCGKYPSTTKDAKTGKHSVHKYYRSWVNMMHRAYGLKSSANSYRDVEVCDIWLNYQNFAEWCADNYKSGFVLDKDLKNLRANLYSPENCEFIPAKLNNIIYPNKRVSGKYPIGVVKYGTGYICEVLKPDGIRWKSCRFDTAKEASELYSLTREACIQKTAWIYHHNGMISDELFNSLNTLSLDGLYQQEVAV